MCLRKTPSNCVGSAFHRATRALVLRVGLELDAACNRGSRTHPTAWRNFASMLAPDCQRERRSHVQPISSPRCSGRSVRKRVLPIGSPVCATRVANGTSAPASAFASAASRSRAKRVPALPRVDEHPAPVDVPAASYRPSSVLRGEWLEHDDLPLELRCQAVPHGTSLTGRDEHDAGDRAARCPAPGADARARAGGSARAARSRPGRGTRGLT